MKILITGGAGFIGSTLCQHLISSTDHDVINVDKLTYASNLASLASVQDNPRYQFIQADIIDRHLIEEVLLKHEPDWIIHLAAESHVDRSLSEAADFINTNIIGTYALLEAARTYWTSLAGAKKSTFRFLHVSTDEVYGSLGENGLFCEQTAYDPSSPYSASKAASDHLAMAWHRSYDLPVLISNCSNNYGPRQFPEKLIPLMIINGLSNKPLPVYGNGTNVRDWLFVEDHAKALILILEKGAVGEKYNVGGHNERSNIDVVTGICDRLDQAVPADYSRRDLIEFVTDRPGHDQRYAIDASKLETQLGWKADEDFESGLTKTVDWYITNRNWWQPLQKIYSGQRLGV